MIPQSWILQARTHAGWRLDVLAAAIERPESTLRRWESDEDAVPPPVTRAIATALDPDGTPAPSWWPEAVRHRHTLDATALAALCGVSLPTLEAAFRRLGVALPLAREAADDDAPPPRPGSKDERIVPFHGLLGRVPDAEIARRAGVSVRTIASYRARHDIDGYRGRRRRPPPRGQRESRVASFRHLLGEVPDRVVADLAGMSLGAIRNYRVKKGIAAAGRMSADEVAQRLRSLDLPRPREPQAETPPARPRRRLARGEATPGRVRRTAPEAPPATAPALAWRVRFRRDGRSEDAIVVATDMGQAVDRAIEAAGGEQAVEGVERVGEIVLP